MNANLGVGAASLLPLFAVTLVTAAVPGPGVFYVMRAGGTQGRAAGIWAALGTTFACILMVSATAIGATQLLIAAPRLYDLLRIGGGAYLIWFAIGLWMASSEINVDDGPRDTNAPFRQAALIGLTNPKGLLYFASILAPFFAPGRPRELQAAAGILVVATCLGWYGTVALAFSVPRIARAYIRYNRMLDRIASLLIGACGMALCANLW